VTVESGAGNAAFTCTNLAIEIEKKGWPFQKAIILPFLKKKNRMITKGLSGSRDITKREIQGVEVSSCL